MIFLIISIVVPLGIYLLLPTIIENMFSKMVKRDLLLLIACLLFFISWYVPSPLIQGNNTSFSTHFIGGGLFSGYIWLYLKRSLNLKTSLIVELVSLFAFVSALGVANELFELLITQLGLVRLNPADTWWDLLANTSGVLLFWIIYRIFKLSGRDR